MTTYNDWSGAHYPWDNAKCGCCLVMHMQHSLNVIPCRRGDEHKHMIDVVNEQDFSGFYLARYADAHQHGIDGPTPKTDKWLTDNLEKATALRELFKDEYAYNPAPPEQTELPLEPQVVGTKV